MGRILGCWEDILILGYWAIHTLGYWAVELLGCWDIGMLGFSQKNFPPAARPVFGVLGHLGSCLLWLWGSWALKPLGSEALGLLGCWDVQKSFFLFLGHTKCYSGTPKKKFFAVRQNLGLPFFVGKKGCAGDARRGARAQAPLVQIA